MDPLTMLAIAQAAVSGVQLIQNYFSGQDEITKAKKRQQGQYDLQKKQIDTQFGEGQKQITQAAGGDAAGLAARGIQGNFADLAVDVNRADRTAKLNTWKDGAMSSLDLGFNNAMEDLNQASDQLNLDALMGGLGVGLSAAGTIIDANKLGKQDDWTDFFTGDSYAKRKAALASYDKIFGNLGPY